jgi:hypothetical protein
MSRRTHLTLLAVALALVGAACNNTTPATPRPPSPTYTTDTFQDSINPNGAKSFSFAVQTAGTVTATLTTVSPDATIPIGLAVGTWDGSACSVFKANDNAKQDAAVTVTASGPGNLCVRVYDVGKLTANASFVVTVVHP